MKSIEIDDDLYTYIASQTKHIGESASDILRRLLMGDTTPAVTTPNKQETKKVVETPAPKADAAKKPATTAKTADSKPAAKRSVTKSDDILDRVTSTALSEYAKRVDQFLYILSVAHELNADNFSSVESIKGKNRVYFAQSKEQLLETGSSTNPKQIPNSDFWVVTNNNTAKKVTMLKQVLDMLGYSGDVVEGVVKQFS